MIIAWILGAILVGFAGMNKKGGFLRAFAISLLLSPVVGLFLTLGGAKKNPKGCMHCGNKDNEAEFCGICGKNEGGEVRPAKMIKKQIKIDDTVIAKRDPMRVIDPLWWTVNIYESKDKYEASLQPYSFYQRSVFALMWYMAEVNNGGHVQFYSNSTGIVWEDAMNGFELIQLMEGREIIFESTKCFGKNPSFEREERESLLDSLNEDFDDLDSRFYELDQSVNITERIADFIQENKEAFYFEGEIEVPERTC